MNLFYQKSRKFGGNTGVISLVCRLFDILHRTFRDSRFLIHGIGKIRRFFLVHFNKDYVKRQLFARQGECRQCGTCCNLLNTCPMLTKNGRCFAYGTCRPQVCKIFPIDERDLAEVKICGQNCGFHFNNAVINIDL